MFNPNALHIMVDIEGFDTVDTAIITNIGACLFNFNTGTIDATFYTKINWKNQMLYANKRRSLSANTLEWWLHKDRQKAREELVIDATSVDLKSALVDLMYFIWNPLNEDTVFVKPDNNKKDSGALFCIDDNLFTNPQYRKNIYLWSKGFYDIGALQHAYVHEGLSWAPNPDYPWLFRNIMCSRPVFLMAKMVNPEFTPYMENKDDAHNALGDAKNQALKVIEAFRTITGKKHE